MNAWLIATAVLSGTGFPACLWLALRGAPELRLAGVALAGPLVAVLFVLLAQGVNRSSYVDMALLAAVLGPAGMLVFARGLAGERTPRHHAPRRRAGEDS
ncbi:MrpF/PhaF family protein [Yinghuangia seranimata]|uniref:MrpF/PhaF family protein n=1 Tax=Yinghuangia seranimata TaxID=408067 RepID=UPI0031B9E9B5